MLNMSFMLTAPQYVDCSKDVTRRLGWLKLKPGDYFCGVLKGQGLKKGEKVTRLGVSIVVSVRREPLCDIDASDVVREGFPELSVSQFIDMFCAHNKCTPKTPVTRIEFRPAALAEPAKKRGKPL